jgi:hypothetical protein
MLWMPSNQWREALAAATALCNHRALKRGVAAAAAPLAGGGGGGPAAYQSIYCITNQKTLLKETPSTTADP